jgi:hypothetical protein
LSLLDKIFGKKEPYAGEIKFNDLPAWLESKHKKISEDISRSTISTYSGIEKAQKDIRESLSSLEKATPEGRFHLKMVKIASSNRDNMAKQVRMLLENITLPKDNSIKTIMAFHDAAVQAIGVCLENMMKSYQYTKLLYADESKTVITDVNTLGRLLNELIEPINDQKHVLDALENSNKNILDIKNITSDIGSREKTIKDNQEKINILKTEIEEKQSALDRLRDSDSWKYYLKSRDDLDILENNARKKESEIKDIVSPMNKALNRLKQLSDSGRYTLKPEEKEGLNQCLLCPADVPPEFFIGFRKIIESDVLNIPPEKKEKFLEQISIAESSLGGLKTEYYELNKAVELKKDEITGMKVVNEEKEFMSELENLQNKLISYKKELEMSEKHTIALKEDIEKRRQELQQSISVIDRKVRVL